MDGQISTLLCVISPEMGIIADSKFLPYSLQVIDDNSFDSNENRNPCARYIIAMWGSNIKMFMLPFY